MTRREVVYTVLRERANEWTSGNVLVEAGSGWRFSARIYELRQAGHVIEERPDPTGRTRTHEYKMVVTEVSPGQVAIWEAA